MAKLGRPEGTGSVKTRMDLQIALDDGRYADAPDGPLMLDFIDAYLDCHGYGPTYRDIADGCRLSSPSVAFYQVELLERRGLISRDPLIARSIRTRREQTAAPEEEGAAA